jgi:hypothetical protein
MSNQLPPAEANEVARRILEAVDEFLNRRPLGNDKGWEELKSQLLAWVEAHDSNVAFSGLLWILETQSRYQYQLVAGEILDRASLAGNVALPDLLRRILPQFNASARTVPRWLCNTYGRSAVSQTLKEISSRSQPEELAGKVRSMLYHV